MRIEHTNDQLIPIKTMLHLENNCKSSIVPVMQDVNPFNAATDAMGSPALLYMALKNWKLIMQTIQSRSVLRRRRR
ncbi:hypothetical protein DPMN_121539 [Dreissena polymorpha]|uniref:Uncharacterized protein n=1 Tax=Dreissena polymorpha TaxID=45954 RepID=A0A9D4GQX0_DREPO|nr:hypothetical protein DPMN_121539 [Dreissena polymorpha]